MGAPYAAPNNSLHQPNFWPNDKPPTPPWHLGKEELPVLNRQFHPMARGRQTVVLQTLICDGRFATSNTGEKHWLINMFPIEIAIWSASPHVLDKPKTMHCK
jgi:hypothetical protein